MLVRISEARFNAAYRLGKQVTEQGVKSFEARDSSDRVVMVHFLGSVLSPETQKRLVDLAALPPERKTGLEGAFQLDYEAVLVTGFMPHVRSFNDWFVSVAGERTLTDETERRAKPDFTHDSPTLLTSTLEGGSDRTRRPEGAVPDQQPTGASDSKQGASDFTRMFGPIKADSEGLAESRPPGKEPGEFTRVFGALAEEPPKPAKQSESRSVTTPGPAGPSGTAPVSDRSGGGFTEVFGPGDRAPASAGQSQTLADPPSPPSPPIRPAQPPEAKGSAEPRPAKPRIVWRDRSKEATPPEPSQPQDRVRWQKDEAEPPVDSILKQPAPAPDSGSAPGPSPSRSEATPSGPPGSRMPATPPPQEAPGQFTQIFGQELSSGAASAGPGSRAPDWPTSSRDDEFPPHYKAPQHSVSDQGASLPDRKSSDYLRALSGDASVETPRAAPAPERPPIQQEQYSPDLPPPLAAAPPPTPAPSDYTRMMAGPAVQPKEAPVPPPAPVASPEPEIPEPAETRTPTWLWVALATIGIIAVLLVVLVVLT